MPKATKLHHVNQAREKRISISFLWSQVDRRILDDLSLTQDTIQASKQPFFALGSLFVVIAG
jgi:hypothetical protein